MPSAESPHMIQARPSSFVRPARPAVPRILDTLPGADDPMRGGVLMLGNFDGFHRGHRALAARARTLAFGRPVGLMSCEPHPRAFFGTESTRFRLSTPGSKARVLTGAGVDFVYQPRFDGAFAGQTPEEFVRDVLARGLGVAHVLAGPDFRFGCKRAGDLATLERLGRTHGFKVGTVDKLTSEGADVSSTRIRELIRAGRMDAATDLLGGDWVIEATRRADGQLWLHDTLCRPRPGRYRACLRQDGRPAVGLDIDIGADGRIVPRRPLPAAGAYLFHITATSRH